MATTVLANGDTMFSNSANISNIDISEDGMKELLSVEKDVWLEDVEDQKKYFAQFGDRLPKEIKEQLEALKNNLK